MRRKATQYGGALMPMSVARWCVYLDHLGIEWTYTHKDGPSPKPDLWLPKTGIYLEFQSGYVQAEEEALICERCRDLHDAAVLHIRGGSFSHADAWLYCWDTADSNAGNSTWKVGSLRIDQASGQLSVEIPDGVGSHLLWRTAGFDGEIEVSSPRERDVSIFEEARKLAGQAMLPQFVI